MKFHQLAWITTVLIGIQMVMAGLIVGEDAGLVCPNWPFCGTPIATGYSGSFVLEMIHRFTAALLGVVVIWLFVWLMKSYRDNRAMVWTCTLGLISLAIQIIYAGLIVLFVLPGIASTVDVMNSVVMLTLFLHLANLARREYQIQEHVITAEPDAKTQALKPSAWVLYGAGMLAVLAGAVFRHTGASQALFGQDSYIRSHDQYNVPSMPESHWLLGIHVTTGVLLIVAAVWFARAAFKYHRMVNMVGVVLALIVVQCLLGVASLAVQLQLVVVTLHWAMAGLVMAVAAYILSSAYLATKAHAVAYAALDDMESPTGAH